MAFDPRSWHDLFGAVATASAALLGLFVVAISLHVQLVEGHPVVRNQARVSLLYLALLLAFSITGLVPGITVEWLAAELVAIVLLTTIVYASGYLRAHSHHVPIPRDAWERMTVVVVFDVLFLAAAGSLLWHRGPGLYLVVPAVVILLPSNVFMAWRVIFSPELSAARGQMASTSQRPTSDAPKSALKAGNHPSSEQRHSASPRRHQTDGPDS